MLESDSPLNDPEGRTVAWFQNLAQTQPLSKPILIGALIIAAAIVLAKPIDRWLNPVGRYIKDGPFSVFDTATGTTYRSNGIDDQGRPHLLIFTHGPGESDVIVDKPK